jgi:hypothetical protein
MKFPHTLEPTTPLLNFLLKKGLFLFGDLYCYGDYFSNFCKENIPYCYYIDEHEAMEESGS